MDIRYFDLWKWNLSTNELIRKKKKHVNSLKFRVRHKRKLFKIASRIPKKCAIILTLKILKFLVVV